MDIIYHGKSWLFSFGLGGFKYAVNKDGSLSLTRDSRAKYKRDAVGVQTPTGVFLETVGPDGTVIQDGGDGDWYHVALGKEPVTLRRKILPDPDLTPSQLEKKRGKTTVTVVDQERHDSGLIDFGASYENGSLLRVIASFNNAIEKIPKQYRAKARCEIDSNSGYEGSHYAHVEISYERPETDEEVIARVKIERERERLKDKADRAKLAALKKRLES